MEPQLEKSPLEDFMSTSGCSKEHPLVTATHSLVASEAALVEAKNRLHAAEEELNSARANLTSCSAALANQKSRLMKLLNSVSEEAHYE